MLCKGIRLDMIVTESLVYAVWDMRVRLLKYGALAALSRHKPFIPTRTPDVVKTNDILTYNIAHPSTYQLWLGFAIRPQLSPQNLTIITLSPISKRTPNNPAL